MHTYRMNYFIRKRNQSLNREHPLEAIKFLFFAEYPSEIHIFSINVLQTFHGN